MATLYSLHLSRHVRGMVKGPVQATPAAYAGHLCQETKELVAPDREAIRACLPASYRKALDRSGGTMWFPGTTRPNDPAHVTLRDRKGRYLNTLYAQPYTFTPTT